MATTTTETPSKTIEHIELRAHVRDIAACKKIDSEQPYRSLFDASAHPMWVYDRRTFSFPVINEAAMQSYGYSAPQFNSLSVWTLSVPTIRPPG